MNQVTLQDIFQQGFAAYAQTHHLPAFIHKAASDIMRCRTAALGGHIQACPAGHFERNHYNSCRHRSCPQCAYIQVQKWLARQSARLLATDHYHVIFTMPHELNPLWRYNTKLLTDLLFTCASETITELLQDPKYLGARPGIIASLHTWSKTLILHPHVHCLVTGGGLHNGQWIKLRRDYLFPFAVASKLFKGKLLAQLSQALANGKLTVPDDMNAAALKKLLPRLWRKKWNVKIQDKYTHGQAYHLSGPLPARRPHRQPPHRQLDNGQVTFHVGRDQRQLLTLPIAEFIARFVQHIPKPSTVLIRSYGLYASTCRTQLDTARQNLGQQPHHAQPAFQTWQDILAHSLSRLELATDQKPWLCPVCGQRLIARPLATSTRRAAAIGQSVNPSATTIPISP